MAIIEYGTSRDVSGWTAWNHGAWSDWMNSYAIHNVNVSSIATISTWSLRDNYDADNSEGHDPEYLNVGLNNWAYCLKGDAYNWSGSGDRETFSQTLTGGQGSNFTCESTFRALLGSGGDYNNTKYKVRSISDAGNNYNVGDKLSWGSHNGRNFNHADFKLRVDSVNNSAKNIGTISGSKTFTALGPGTFTLTGASDDSGDICLDGECTNTGGFKSSGNSVSKVYGYGDTVTVSWSVSNSTTSADSFYSNPVGIAWRLVGPDTPPAPEVSISASPNPWIYNTTNGVTVSWTISGDALTSKSVTGVSSPANSGSKVFYPSDDQSYTVSASNPGGSDDATVNVVVYIPPTVNVLANGVDDAYIILGDSATITWPYTGDANSISWSSGGIVNNNLSGSAVVSPIDTTSYCGSVSGLGGTSPTNCATVHVYQPPQLDVTWPTLIDYGTNATVTYTAKYSNTSVTLGAVYKYEVIADTDLTGVALTKPNSAENGVGTIEVDGSYTTNIPWNNRGPISVQYVITAIGSGGSITKTSPLIPVNIDRTPDQINPPISDNKVIEDPVITPDTDVLSSMMLVDDIDILVEVKANYPILVQKNNDGDWEQIRQI